MVPKTPTIDELRSIAFESGFRLSDEDLHFFQGLMIPTLESYGRLDQMQESSPDLEFPRTTGYRPSPEDNPFGAWYVRCSIKGGSGGVLVGKRVAIKDNVCVAGLPMMNGSSVLEGYVPQMDATVVTRILNAGGEIVGKSVCEHLSFSGSSFTSDSGPVRNPHDSGRSAGGSSSGSGALLAAGEVDIAIGGDQGGSIRIPASFCGVYGLKPTYGLVPYTGIFPIEMTLDHTGPMGRTVEDVARLLEAIAGEDGLDPRQVNPRVEPYLDALDDKVNGLRIGIVRDGFDWPGMSEVDVDQAVEAAAQEFVKLGATVKSIAVPLHRQGVDIWNGIAVEGTVSTLINGNGMGLNWKGKYNVSLLDAFARGRASRPNDLSETVKEVVLLGRYMQQRYHGRYYAKAQNLAPMLKRAYDSALEECDVLVMPTTPMTATPLPTAETSRAQRYELTLNMLNNTAPFDVTGHPAMNVPCGRSGKLPIGMMLVGRIGDDATLLRTAHAFEQTGMYSGATPAAVTAQR